MRKEFRMLSATNAPPPLLRQMLGAIFLVGTSASFALAQWSVVNLHPVGATESFALGVEDGNQVGYAGVGGNEHASVWNGSAASWVDLHPSGWVSSEARGYHAGQQAGFVLVQENSTHASLWRGS